MSDKPCSRENGFRVDCIKHYAEVEAENARLKAEVERLRKELAEAQENYHLVNEMVARLRKEGKPPSV